ncbi:interleukin-13 receptor subunit alpha-1-like isoform X2 [Pristis pectinata]|uniref:interleukin-13 receptor subunit alpha-1-like isoform X2 n=1 Tax=Pristis pectinata TaxID=685728 RepID=UPI00223DD67C|nr:interleukin-13 receptor subunit alpha-1-like isoform X2 [Pristis pectinata]
MSPIPPLLQLAVIWIIAANGSPSTTVKGTDVFPTIEDIFNKWCLKKATSIIKDPHHPGHSLFTLLPSRGNQSSSIRNVTCLFYNENHVNCTWDIDETASPDTQYCLSYGLNEPKISTPCGKIEPGKVACFIHNFKEHFYDSIIFCVMDSCQQPKTIHCTPIVPVECYKTSPPVNVTVSGSEVVWKPPIGEHHSRIFEYQIQVTDLHTKVAKVEDLDQEKWDIKDLSKSYAVQVRAKINHFLEVKQEDFIWSDWTRSVFTEPEQTNHMILKIFIVTAIITILMVLLLMFICRRYKLLEHLSQPIPDPKQKFNGLFENYNGEFQWINANHPETKDPKECDAVIVED